MPKKEVSELEKEQIRRRVMREFPLSKCLRDIHYYRYVREIEEQTMSPEEIITEIREKVHRLKEEMKQ
jgi:hypothetical protein